MSQKFNDMESKSELFIKSQLQKPVQNNTKSNTRDRESVTMSSPRKSSSLRSRGGRPRETEEEAVIRRLHDAQRMARFRARKKKALEDQLVVGDAKNDRRNGHESDPERQHLDNQTETGGGIVPETESKYSQLLAIIERLGRDVRLSYAGSRSSAERLKSGIVRARTLVRDCLIETRLNLRQ